MDINKAFDVNSLTVYNFFTRGRIGYNIPQYQRPYSWDNENIDQLMDDICSGMFDVLNNENEIHFMGTVITVLDNDFRTKVSDPIKKSALPTGIEDVIDGQQRLSTIALLACCIYEILSSIDSKLPSTNDYYSLKEATAIYLNNLQNLFSYNLETRGIPPRKPIIIREPEDEWTLHGNESSFYKSDVTNFLARFIRAVHEKTDFPKLQASNQVADNVKKIKQCLQEVKNAHQTDMDKAIFPPAWEIINKINQKEFWDYPRTEEATSINALVDKKDNDVCTLIQVLGFSYYLLNCCCFTSIVPTSEVRAFDMFQSLNATGTPLTALETFKPLIVNSVTLRGQQFEESQSRRDFEEVEVLFEKLRSASSKNQRTNEYLTLFAQTYNGSQLSKQFSKQRSWLTGIYENFSSLQEKEKFVRKMGDVALYSKQFVYSNSPNNIFNYIGTIAGGNLGLSPETKEAALCVLYLLDAKHKMAHTILSRYFSVAKYSSDDTEKKAFLSSCKAIAAFFTLWRSALVSYPDREYRRLLQVEMPWDKNIVLTFESLKLNLIDILKKNGIDSKDAWISKASQNLKYSTNKAVCKFFLFVTAEDTIPDALELGLMKLGQKGSTASYLEPSKWISENLGTIEHIAPQDIKAGNQWDSKLYENDNYNKIGNLTLLPSKVNTSASNKGWVEKYIYYRHLAEQDPEKFVELRQLAVDRGVNLNPSTISLLENSSYNHHILPIIQLGIDGSWNKDIVEARTKRMCSIVWERLSAWLT